MPKLRFALIAFLCALSIGSRLPWVAGVAAAERQVQAEVIPDGTYDVLGTNRNGSKYTGTAVIAVNGKSVAMTWLITGGQTYRGKGTLKNGQMVVDFGSRYPVIYNVGSDGVLHGTWDKGRASETLIPK